MQRPRRSTPRESTELLQHLLIDMARRPQAIGADRHPDAGGSVQT